MPYIPRSYASTSVPDAVDIPKRPVRAEKRDPVAYRPDTTDSHELNPSDEKGRLKITSRLSIRGHSVDPARVYEMLTGKKAEIDEHSRQLV